MKSITLSRCRAQGHVASRHSPNGVDIILECSDCCMAWLVNPASEEIRLTDSSYERRLIEQRIAPAAIDLLR